MKAIVLFSGGLDSLLAIRIIKDSGVELFALNFVSPFCKCKRKDSCSAVVHLKNIGIDYRLINIGEEYLEILRKPKFGFGSNMNPCLDCRILMFKKAKALMLEMGAAFVITGEVLGQRPMSQQKRQLELIEKETGLSDLILRPLSAKLLPETIPEKESWIDRGVLLGFSGRMRSPQIRKAYELGLKDYPCPSGGCLLTDRGFSRRVRDLLRYSQLTLEEVEFLKVGRHFRLTDKLKLVVGRNKQENQRLLTLVKEGDICFAPSKVNGPAALARRLNGEKSLEKLCASIVARYCDREDGNPLPIDKWQIPHNKRTTILESPISESELEKLRI